MRADYATSDLISKVNADWINAVLINRELDHGDADDEAAPGEPVPQPGPGKQIVGAWPKPMPKPMPPSAKPTRIARPMVIPDPVARLRRRRSVGRRVGERLALAAAALVIVWVGIRAAPEAREATDPVAVRATDAAPDPAAPISTTELRPGWLLPEILYGPAMAYSPISAPRPGR
jgi:hypothetical protein